jgi:hypothetical protein
MAYDAGDDGGATEVLDLVTGLTWSRASRQASTLTGAWTACRTLGSTWRVPSRIELVSLVDFTRAPPLATADPVAFPDTQTAAYWTASPVAGSAVPDTAWTVSFASGLVANSGGATQVRCVRGGTP